MEKNGKMCCVNDGSLPEHAFYSRGSLASLNMKVASWCQNTEARQQTILSLRQAMA